jgi:hypothetical protein
MVTKHPNKGKVYIFNRYYIRLGNKKFPDLPDFVKKYLEDSIKTRPVG